MQSRFNALPFERWASIDPNNNLGIHGFSPPLHTKQISIFDWYSSLIHYWHPCINKIAITITSVYVYIDVYESTFFLMLIMFYQASRWCHFLSKSGFLWVTNVTRGVDHLWQVHEACLLLLSLFSFDTTRYIRHFMAMSCMWFLSFLFSIGGILRCSKAWIECSWMALWHPQQW